MHNIPNIRMIAVKSAINRGYSTLDELGKECLGIYPTELLDIIEGLLKLNEIKEFSGNYFINNSNHILPEPHPHDYDWRFSNRTVEDISSLLIHSSKVGRKCLFIGTPSVFAHMRHHHENFQSTLIDNNESLVNTLNCQLGGAIHHNIFNSLISNELNYDVCLIDPPWYNEHYISFIAQAAFSVKLNGEILISLLPLNTRPSSVEDRSKIFKSLDCLGVHITKLIPDFIKYKAPTFEKTSLSNQQIDISSDWRSSDLLVVKKHVNLDISHYINTISNNALPSSFFQWTEFLINNRKIKLRAVNSLAKINEPRIVSFLENDILPTVSNRFEKRELIDLWLWDNRVYKVEGHQYFLEALCTLSGKQTNSIEINSTEYDKVLKAKQIIENILN